MTNQHHRIYTFDLLRGLAVLTMMLAHSVYFFHNRESHFLLGLETLGNTVSFVTFLLVSGAVAFVAHFAGHHGQEQPVRQRAFTRIALLWLAYYLLALVLSGPAILQAEGFARIRLVFDILSFRYLPGFTEYFPPFIFYSALLTLAPGFFWRASKTLKSVLAFSIPCFLAGWGLYHLPVGDILRPWVALLAGAAGVFRFPLLHYLPVFLLGLYWGRRTLALEGIPAKRQLSWRLGGFFACLAGAAWLASSWLGWSRLTVFSRWPPAIPFLALGLSFAFLAAVALYAVHQFRRIPLVRDGLLMFGQNALGLFWSHVFLLGLYAAAGGPKVSSVAIFLFLLVLLITLSVALTTFLPFNFRLALTSIRGSHEEHEEALAGQAVFRLSKDVAAEAVVASHGLRNFFFPGRRTTTKRGLKRRHKLGLSLIAVVTAAFIFPATTQEFALQRQQQGATLWWSDAYAYRQQVTLKNTEPFVTLKAGTPVALRFNHQQLVEEGKSRADGLDVKLVYWTGDKHLVAQSFVADPNTEQATLKFRAPVDIQSGQPDQYYTLYYGQFIPTQTSAGSLVAKSTVTATFAREQAFPYLAGVSKNWNLIGTEDGATVAFHLTTPTSVAPQTVSYEVLNTSLMGDMMRSADRSWEAIIPVESLKPGAYQIRATVHDGPSVHTSQSTGFYRSYPLYVAWTQDWEGYDANQAYLDAIAAIATQFRLPVTHFFNPRIYVTKSISPVRAQALTDWVKRRVELGDGYGLHLHMFTDFVESAGVKPRAEPDWGDNGSGYGVLMSAYTKDEQEQMISYALKLLVAHGFGKTNIFRAGGWYANLDTFAALEDLGFQVDSSARTSYQFGKNRLPGFWNIHPTTQPYFPSRTDQNISAGNNDFPVLEIPDNGADSYAFSAADMISRFAANLGNGILNDKQQVTYLTHPHWFDEKEQTRIRQLFTYVSRYSAANDQGPVIFTTTAAIANIWTNGQ